MFDWLRRSQSLAKQLPFVDLHSHLLAGLDDGVQSVEEAADLVKEFQSLGYRKLYTTPHVMSDFYKNSADDILTKRGELKAHLNYKGIEVEIQAAAEYYLDENLMDRIQKKEKLLTIGSNFLLFETNFMTEPLTMKEFIFAAQTSGYRLIFAHPERYIYLQNDIEKAEDLINRGVLFQMNISSLSGYYSKGAQQLANKLINKGWVHFIGSDCHNMKHMDLLKHTVSLKSFQKVLNLPLLNNSLL